MNQQYITMPFADDVGSLGEAETLFDDKISFVISDDEFGKKLSLFCAGGKAIAAPVQKTALDPLAKDTMLGKNLPAIRGWVEPNLTDHLFFIQVPEHTKSLMVKAIDGFGNTYQESISL
jgi:hypothetical protein